MSISAADRRLLRRADLHADRILHAAQEFDMRAVGLARAVADPQEMRRAAVPVAGGGIDAGQRLLIRQQQRLVAGVEIGLAQICGVVSLVMPQAAMKFSVSSMRAARSW
jgi:hypothetical protein